MLIDFGLAKAANNFQGKYAYVLIFVNQQFHQPILYIG